MGVPEVPGCEVLGLVGQGGNAGVWRGRRGRQPVAIKVPLDAGSEVQRALLRCEVEDLQDLYGITGVVPLADFGPDEANVEWIVMPLYETGSLHRWLEGQHLVDVSEVVRCGAGLAKTLSLAHNESIVHGDVKPSNVFAARDGIFVLGDWGSGRFALTHTSGAAIGSGGYSAPEVRLGERPQSRSDVFSLAVTLIALLVGRDPFTTGDPRDPAVNSRLDTAMLEACGERVGDSTAQLLRACVETNPADRPIASQVAEALRGWRPRGQSHAAESAGSMGIVSTFIGGLEQPHDPRAQVEEWFASGNTADAVMQCEFLAQQVGTDAIWALERLGDLAVADDDVSAARSRYQQAVDAGSTTAGGKLAELSTEGVARRGREFAEADAPDRAITWLRVAATEGHAPAMVALAKLLVEVDPHGAEQLWNQAADAGDAEAAALVEQRMAVDTVAARAHEATDDGADDSDVATDPTRGRVTEHINVDGPSWDMTFAAERLWVTDGSGSLRRIDPGTGRVTTTSGSLTVPRGVAFGAGSVWVANYGADTVARIDPDSLVARTIPVGKKPLGVAFFAERLWVANHYEDTLSRIDPSIDCVDMTVPVGQSPTNVTHGAGSIWVTNAASGSVQRIDPASGKVIATIPVGNLPSDATYGAGSIWVANSGSATVTRIDTRRDVATDTVTVYREPYGVAFAAGTVWVTGRRSGVVARIDPTTHAVSATIVTGGRPHAVAFGAGSIWVADLASKAVSRIDPSAPPAAPKPPPHLGHDPTADRSADKRTGELGFWKKAIKANGLAGTLLFLLAMPFVALWAIIAEFPKTAMLVLAGLAIAVWWFLT